MQQEGSLTRRLIGQLCDWHLPKMVYSSLIWCLVNGVRIILKCGAMWSKLEISKKYKNIKKISQYIPKQFSLNLLTDPLEWATYQGLPIVYRKKINFPN